MSDAATTRPYLVHANTAPYLLLSYLKMARTDVTVNELVHCFPRFRTNRHLATNALRDLRERGLVTWDGRHAQITPAGTECLYRSAASRRATAIRHGTYLFDRG